jgi:sulfatase modifying factor 1
MNYVGFFPIILVIPPIFESSAALDEEQLFVEEYVTLQEPVKYCPANMVRVVGAALPSMNDAIEALQDSTCSEWISTQFPARCARFDRAAWNKISTKLPKHSMNFCMDTYEFPNVKGELPKVFVSYNEAKGVCNSLGKRLCTETEWIFACEGEEGLPYPYGYERDANACNIDHKWIDPDIKALQDSKRRDNELKRLWQGVRSGSMEACVSPFGIHDMTGNIDELTTSVRKAGHRSILKGGYWSTVRNRCRPSTRIHNENFAFYQQGLRCCTDIITDDH